MANAARTYQIEWKNSKQTINYEKRERPAKSITGNIITLYSIIGLKFFDLLTNIAILNGRVRWIIDYHNCSILYQMTCVLHSDDVHSIQWIFPSSWQCHDGTEYDSNQSCANYCLLFIWFFFSKSAFNKSHYYWFSIGCLCSTLCFHFIYLFFSSFHSFCVFFLFQKNIFLSYITSSLQLIKVYVLFTLGLAI